MKYRIRDGTTVTPHGMPWQAALVESPKPKDCLGKPCKATVGCGASIICPNYVISAAHCSYIYETIDVPYNPWQPFRKTPKLVKVAEAEPNDQHLVIGIHDLLNDLGIEYPIESITIHPTYKMNNKPVKPPREESENECDVSLYKLKNPIDFFKVKVAMAIHLPDTRDHLHVGTILTHSGWGLDENGKQPWQLKAANVPLVKAEDCYNQYKRCQESWGTSKVCTGYPDGKYGTGSSDSGGKHFENNSLVRRCCKF